MGSALAAKAFFIPAVLKMYLVFYILVCLYVLCNDHMPSTYMYMYLVQIWPICRNMSIWNQKHHCLEIYRTFQDVASRFKELSSTKVIFRNFPGPGNFPIKIPGLSRIFQEAWKPWVSIAKAHMGVMLLAPRLATFDSVWCRYTSQLSGLKDTRNCKPKPGFELATSAWWSSALAQYERYHNLTSRE